MSDDVNPQAKALAESLAQFGASGKAGGEAARLFGDNLQDLDYDLLTVGSGGMRKFEVGFASLMETIGGEGPGSQSIGKARERLKAYDEALAQLASSGHADEAAAAFKRMWVEAQKQDISLDDLQAAFPGYISAAAEAAKANDAQALSTAEVKRQNIKLAGAFGEAANEADGLKKAFDDLNGAELTWRDAERSAEAAIDDLTDALKESNGSLDVHNEKGRNAAAAVDRVAEAAAKASQAKMDETHSVDQANVVYQSYIDQLRATLVQAGYTKAEVDGLVSSIATMPSTKTVTINATVNVNTSRLNKVLDQLGRYESQGGVLTYAGGGTYENHVAQVAPAGAMRVWAEPETGGEAYIPLSAAKRGRSLSVLADVDRRFGHPLSGGASQVNVSVSTAPGADSQMLGGIMQYLRFTVDTQHAGDPKAAFSRRRR